MDTTRIPMFMWLKILRRYLSAGRERVGSEYENIHIISYAQYKVV